MVGRQVLNFLSEGYSEGKGSPGLSHSSYGPSEINNQFHQHQVLASHSARQGAQHTFGLLLNLQQGAGASRTLMRERNMY
jgi:hypothetical protein